MKAISTSKTRIIALLLALVMAIGLTACGSNTGGAIIDPDTGTVTEIPSPNAGGKSWLDWGGWGKDDSNNSNDNSSNTTKTDSHVPGTPRESKPMNKNILRMVTNSYTDGKLTTLVKSVKTPSKYDGKTSSNDTNYGKVDWSTANQGYISFTAKGQTREFILEGPNGKQTLCTVAKGETIKVALLDDTGKYQYAIANTTNNGKSYSIQYKNSFSVSKIDSDLAPYLVSTPWGDYDNAPNAVAKANELWDTNKNQFDNIQTITNYVTSTLKYDKKLKAGTIDVYVNPDKVIENGGGVCNEMAKTLVAMLRSQGVPAYLQCGKNAKGQAHGWVMAWIETSSATKNGITTSTGTWLLIESTGSGIQTINMVKNYTPDQYAG